MTGRRIDASASPTKKLSHSFWKEKAVLRESDCGALYLNKDGTPWCMHTAAWRKSGNPITWVSTGTDIQELLNAHVSYFGSVTRATGGYSMEHQTALGSTLYDIGLETIISIGPENSNCDIVEEEGWVR